jgi:CelD/BcsL family acetyltransferase involved in cellulose biosynthesis
LKAFSGFNFEELTSTDALGELRPDWLELWRCSEKSTPFQSPDWLIPWWKHIGEGKLRTLVLRRNARVVGIVPLYVHVRPQTSLRELFPVGIATTDYLDAIFDGRFASAGAAALFNYLEEIQTDWDICDLQQLPPQSPLLKAPIPEHWRDEISVHGPCPVLSLPSSAAELSTVVSSRLLKELRYASRRLQKLGNVTFEAATASTLEEFLEALLRLHHARWAVRGEPGVLTENGVRMAHYETAARFLDADLLRLYALRLNQKIIAVYYGFMHCDANQRRAYFYLSGFDPEFARLSPAGLIVEHAIRAAINERAAEFDFLRGSEPYKYRWGARDRSTYRRRLWRSASCVDGAVGDKKAFVETSDDR